MMTRFGTLGAAAAAAMLAATSVAIARPDARTMSCEQARALLRQSGAVVLTTGQHTYDRYVSGYNYCSWPMAPTQTWISTADTNQCPVYNCQRVDDGDDDFLLRR